LTAVTLMLKLCVADTSTPPSNTPPLSEIRSVIAAEPLALAASV
jgi:hypothetical protein